MVRRSTEHVVAGGVAIERAPVAPIAAALLAAALTGCGSSGADAPKQATETVAGPTERSMSSDQCEDVWVVGKRLPAGFDGSCSKGANYREGDDGYACADGSHVWLYDDGDRQLYGLPGKAIQTMSDEDWIEYLVGTCKPT
jgi:hypothetical protein